MILWAQFMDHLLPDVPGCVPAMAEIALRHAAREFMERTKAWTIWLDTINTSDITTEYDFEIDRFQEVVKLYDATLDGQPLPVISVNDLPSDWKDSPDGHRGLFTEDRSSFTLLPKQIAGRKLRTRVALKPSMEAVGVEDALFAQYVEDICAGAKARLMASPKKPYTDLALAGMHKANFDARCDQVARQVEKSFSRTPRRVVAQFF